MPETNDSTLSGRIQVISVSDGGVPKQRIPSAEVTVVGLIGDRQAHPKDHGGPERAVCLLGLDVIESLAGMGHPIAPGTCGENLTLAGFPWSVVDIGTCFRFEGGVELQVSDWAVPCRLIAGSFHNDDSSPLDAVRHPGRARAYTRVLQPGAIREGEHVRVIAPD
jgi:MOSC domain-containing protein YiiM